MALLLRNLRVCCHLHPRFNGLKCPITPETIVRFIIKETAAVFEVLIRKIMSSVLARFHSQFVKQRPKKSQSFSFDSFTVYSQFISNINLS